MKSAWHSSSPACSNVFPTIWFGYWTKLQYHSHFKWIFAHSYWILTSLSAPFSYISHFTLHFRRLTIPNYSIINFRDRLNFKTFKSHIPASIMSWPSRSVHVLRVHIWIKQWKKLPDINPSLTLFYKAFHVNLLVSHVIDKRSKITMSCRNKFQSSQFFATTKAGPGNRLFHLISGWAAIYFCTSRENLFI